MERLELSAISPIDGRYRKATKSLVDCFSESALMTYRTRVECEYLLALSKHPDVEELRSFFEDERAQLRDMHKLTPGDVDLIKRIETDGVPGINEGKRTNHDVKAVEYAIKHRLNGTSLKDCVEWVHFGLTSEDINSIAYGLMLRDGLDTILCKASELFSHLYLLAEKHKNLPMLARTHGQPASPTTFGKEFKVFASRVDKQLNPLLTSEILVKLNGATGNYNAHHAAYPDVDWVGFTEQFIQEFNKGTHTEIKLVPNLITTQIEPHDGLAEIFDNLRRLNTVVIDFDQDMWRYISDDWLAQKPSGTGSSTMPHKVNPIDFESSEGNLGIANALLGFFSTKLPISRLQRDLSDSTVMRNIGVALAHSMIGYQSALKGLKKVHVNEAKVIDTLNAHPEVITEALQTILRREGVANPYEMLKDLTQGKRVTWDDINIFIESSGVSEEAKNEMRLIRPTGYTGLAEKLVERKFG